jgi:Tfp pilus assembly protein PilN
MRAVNLLPADATRRRWGARDRGAAKRVLVTAGLVAAVLVALLGAAFVHTHMSVSDKQETLAGLEQKVTAAQAKAASVQAVRASVQGRRVAVTEVDSKRITWEQVLRDLSRVLPGNVWLQNLQAQSPTPTASATTATPTAVTAPTGATPTAFVVTGLTSSQKGVARVIDRLAVLPWLSDVSLQSSTRTDTPGGGKAVQFTIGANLSSTGGK